MLPLEGESLPELLPQRHGVAVLREREFGFAPVFGGKKPQYFLKRR
jgi:hypothetical protein